MAEKLKTMLTQLLDKAYKRSAEDAEAAEAVMNQPDEATRACRAEQRLAFNHELLQALHETLDLQQLLSRFVLLIRTRLPCDGIEYVNDKDNLYFYDGAMHSHQCSFDLRYENRCYGRLIISRSIAFGQSELTGAETLIAGLLPPLRNAVKYEEALIQAQYDRLTGLRKSSYYFETMPGEIERCLRYQQPFSLLLIDIDNFNRISQTCSQQTADRLLQQVAERIVEQARDADIALRYGRERFLLLLPHTDSDNAQTAASRIKAGVSMVYESEQLSQPFTISVGIVSVEESDDSGSLIQRADSALYHAKILGKDRTYVLHAGVKAGARAGEGDMAVNVTKPESVKPAIDEGGLN